MGQLKNIRKKFPVLSKGIYANTAAAGPMHENLFDWRQEHELDLLMGGSKHFFSGLRAIDYSRTRIAEFFGCSVDQLALVPNFSLGMNLLVQMLPKNKNVLLVEEDYPSVNWPFERHDFKLERIGVGQFLEDEIHTAIKEKKINILALSLVQWLSGILLDLDFLKRLKKDNPDLTIIADGTQFCGMFPFEFKNSGIDVLLSSGYKWMLAGYGNGFMLFQEGFMKEHTPTVIGFNSADGNIDQKENILFCKYFEPGHLDSLAMGSFGVSIDFLNEIGMDKINEQNKKLSEHFTTRFLELGLLSEWVGARNKHSTIFNVKADNAMYARLKENGVLGAQRGGGIRFSFNFYNSQEELDFIANLFKDYPKP